MNVMTKFEERMLRGVEFRLPEQKTDTRCQLAKDLAAWCEVWVSPVRANPTEVTVNQVALLLQDQFLERIESAPRGHRTMGSARHTCLIGVYLAYCRELRELRWRVNPPLVRELPPPAAPPQYEIAGVPFGIKK